MFGAPSPISFIESKFRVVPTRVTNTFIVYTYCIYIELVFFICEIRNQINTFT
jgi:hypothetical protein